MTASEIENDHFDLDHFDRYWVSSTLHFSHTNPLPFRSYSVQEADFLCP